LGEAAAELLSTLASNQLKVGKFTEAEQLARRCFAIREREEREQWVTFDSRSLLGASLLGQKKYAEAEPLLLSGYAGLKQREAELPASAKARLNETGELLVQLYETWGKPDQAANWRARLK
jgi:hypothetical protein